jgi:hypothetical protein
MHLFALRMKAEFHCTFFLLPNIRICSTKNHTVMWPCRQSGHKVHRFNLSIKWSSLLAPRPGRLTPGKKPSVTHNRSGRRQTESFQPPSIFQAAASCQNCTIGNTLDFGGNQHRMCCNILLWDLNQTWIFSTYFRQNLNIKFYKNPSSGSRVVPCGRSDGQTWRS